MKITLCCFYMGLWLLCGTLYGQHTHTHFVSGEAFVGTLNLEKEHFSTLALQSGFFASIGKRHNETAGEWVYRLGRPKTALNFGMVSNGNLDALGQSFSLMPTAEFPLFSDKLSLLTGLGAGYHTRQFHIADNPTNRKLSTAASWSFRTGAYWDIVRFPSSSLRLGLNYYHFSNGHTRLPNQGFNSFVVGAVYEMGYTPERLERNTSPLDSASSVFDPSSYRFMETHAGLGYHALSPYHNDAREIYTLAFSYGKVLNNTFKFGGGVYGRFYQHYYDYIRNEEEIVAERFPHFANKPFDYALNLALFATGELLLGHVGMEYQIGFNLYKPFYQVEWMLTQGDIWIAEDEQGEPYFGVIHGEPDWYFEFKRALSSRMGIKYYLKSNREQQRDNFYVGAHINANLGQADFTELSIGYVRGLW